MPLLPFISCLTFENSHLNFQSSLLFCSQLRKVDLCAQVLALSKYEHTTIQRSFLVDSFESNTELFLWRYKLILSEMSYFPEGKIFWQIQKKVENKFKFICNSSSLAKSIKHLKRSFDPDMQDHLFY